MDLVMLCWGGWREYVPALVEFAALCGVFVVGIVGGDGEKVLLAVAATCVVVSVPWLLVGSAAGADSGTSCTVSGEGSYSSNSTSSWSLSCTGVAGTAVQVVFPVTGGDVELQQYRQTELPEAGPHTPTFPLPSPSPAPTQNRPTIQTRQRHVLAKDAPAPRTSFQQVNCSQHQTTLSANSTPP